MKFSTYILYSSTLDQYYVGEPEDFERRLEEHNNGTFVGSFTSKAHDWKCYLLVEFDSRSKSKNFEQFIKKMKSRKFIESLKTDTQKLKDLTEKFSLKDRNP